jgi:hypothetical protein
VLKNSSLVMITSGKTRYVKSIVVPNRPEWLGDGGRERKIYRGTTLRANQTRRGVSPAQIFHSYGQINHDLSAGCTAVWGIERINDAMFGCAASNARLSSLPGVYSRAYRVYNSAGILSFSSAHCLP